MNDHTDTCMNCGSLLRGKYCADCGQKNFGTRMDLKELAGEFVSETFEIEGRLPNTVLSVVFAPGLYLYRYLEGRRKSYSSPLRFYLLALFLSVLVTGWRFEGATRSAAEQGLLDFHYDPVHNDLRIDSSSDHRDRVRETRASQELQRVFESVSWPACPPEDHLVPWWPTSEPYTFDWLETLTPEVTLECLQEEDGFLEKAGLGMALLVREQEGADTLVRLIALTLEQTPLIVSAMIGVVVLLLKVLFWRHPMSVHVLLALTLHALLLYGVMAWMLWPTGWVFWFVHGWLQAHLLFGLKAAYDASWKRTFASYFMLLVLWFPLASIAAIMALILALRSLADTLQ